MAYLFSSNQLSTLVLASRGSPKLLGRDEVTQYIGLSVVSKLLVSFLFFLSLYSCMMPKLRVAWAASKNEIKRKKLVTSERRCVLERE